MSERKCTKCGSTALVDGGLHSPMRTSFRPQSSRFLTLDTGDVMLRASMCRDCGYVEITGDVRKLARLTGEDAT